MRLTAFLFIMSGTRFRHKRQTDRSRQQEKKGQGKNTIPRDFLFHVIRPLIWEHGSISQQLNGLTFFYCILLKSDD